MQIHDVRKQHEVLDLLALMRPLAMRSHGKIRLGNDYDGGYVVPDCALQCDAVVSIGVGPDAGFDFALAQRGAKVIQFDHTVDRLPIEHSAFRFFKKGWGPRTEGEFLSLSDICAQLEGTPQHPLFKFDIEGGEYEIFAEMDPEALRPFEVICCELHDFNKLAEPIFFQRVRHLLECLSKHHAPVHLHANNYKSFVMVEGVPIPEVLELSYLRRDLDAFAGYSREPIARPLDRPNHPFQADLCLNPF